jgi:hypothetical protein
LEETTMLSMIIAAGGLTLAALMVQPAHAGPLSLKQTVQSGGAQVQPVFHEPDFGVYQAPPAYVEPRYVEPRYVEPRYVEPGYGRPALLPAEQIKERLRRDGYSRLDVVALDGPIYTVQGIDPWDNYVEMKVFGHDARVLRSDVIEAQPYDSPFARRPPTVIPEQGPRFVTVPQSPPVMESRTEPRIAAVPLPRSRPAYRPEPSLPDPESRGPVAGSGRDSDDAVATGRRASDRDPLVVY